MQDLLRRKRACSLPANTVRTSGNDSSLRSRGQNYPSSSSARHAVHQPEFPELWKRECGQQQAIKFFLIEYGKRRGHYFAVHGERARLFGGQRAIVAAHHWDELERDGHGQIRARVDGESVRRNHHQQQRQQRNVELLAEWNGHQCKRRQFLAVGESGQCVAGFGAGGLDELAIHHAEEQRIGEHHDHRRCREWKRIRLFRAVFWNGD